ncbi:TlpA family protein disulfide reductase [Dyadobacter sandarakinus]|uniref:TlpA family protein disulfide reductase n=1 Tax=Dyadobacter sandarakinus TaxID=2747268 RepID=A0ABX7I5K3_9BACT|nr:TlpA disulfide reductase family protein [Dyadobacter sandarakinus]QRR00483.1 TlpA family protein disulfide reductase [Dyadobacter sandarakinus]
MFRYFLISLILLSSAATFAQSTAGLKSIAPFSMKLTNGQQYTSAQLAKGPVVLIYFSPDCEHCQDFTQDLVKNYNVVANKQVVMVTFQNMDMLRPFVSKYKLATFPNFKVGTEGSSMLVQRYYQIRYFPYIVIYDKNGKMVKTFEGEQPHEEIFRTLKAI